MIVHAVLDQTSRWFELYETAELAQGRADKLNTRHRTSRYKVVALTVNSAARPEAEGGE